MAVVRVTSRTRIRRAAKATIRYIAHRRDRDGKNLTRTLFGRDGESLSKHQVYRMIDRASRKTTFFRIVISPDRKAEDTRRDFDLRTLTELTMEQLQDRFPGQDIAYIGAIHANHSANRHVHILALIEARHIPVADLKLLRDAATQEARDQRRGLDQDVDIAGFPSRHRIARRTRQEPRQAAYLIRDKGWAGPARMGPLCPNCGPNHEMDRISAAGLSVRPAVCGCAVRVSASRSSAVPVSNSPSRGWGRAEIRNIQRTLIAARLWLDRIAASPFFAKPELSLHKARFAAAHELSALIATPAPDEPCLPLGVGPYGRVLAVCPTPTRRELGNLLVVAPTRRGKGLLAVSQLLTWPYSAIVNDIKGELFDLTAGYRACLGPVFVPHPCGVGHRFDPLASCHDEDDLRAMAVHLLNKSHQEPDPFTKRAIKMLTAIFRAGLLKQARLLPYAAHLLHLGPEAAAERLDRLSARHGLAPDQNLATRLLDRQLADADFSDRYLQSSWSTLTGDMDAVITDKVILTVAGADVTPEDILCGRADKITGQPVHRPVTLYLRFPEHRLHALSPLIRLIWSALLDELIGLYDRRKGLAANPSSPCSTRPAPHRSPDCRATPQPSPAAASRLRSWFRITTSSKPPMASTPQSA